METAHKGPLCRLNLHHRWVRQFNADGEDYMRCKACGKDRYDMERHNRDVPDVFGRLGGGGGFAGGGGFG